MIEFIKTFLTGACFFNTQLASKYVCIVLYGKEICYFI